MCWYRGDEGSSIDYEALILAEDEGDDYDPPMTSTDLPEGYEDSLPYNKED